MQWRAFLDAQRRGLESFARETADTAAPSSCSGLAVPVQAQLFNAAAVVHRGRLLGCVPKEKLPTYNVFYEARTFSRGGPGLAARRRRRAARRLPLRVRLRHGRRSRSARTRGRPTARCAGAASRAPRSSSTSRRRRTAWASTAPAARCWRRAPPTTRRCWSTPTPSARRTASSTTAAASSSRTAGSCTRRRASSRARPRRSSTSIARGGCALEHTTWRADCEAFVRRERPVAVDPQRRRDGRHAPAAPIPAPAGGSFFLPAPSPPPVDARDAALDELFEALALGRGELLRQDRRLPLARPGALGRARLDADAAGGVARRRPHPRTPPATTRRPRASHHRLLHADAALAGRHPHGRARAGRRARRRPAHHPARRGLRPRGRGDPGDARRATARRR